ncbi:DUF3747 domain-containing protein [Leptothoe kymatousa]|uniref:DUF3747 domain-containing protein n=1 Tax=Leptothoe kymatousa TAU-MAC 1615 TaxID=2364775 RepID=A0ABS5Y7A3_9CYAN|nr:DUF3747 domain-containing protein [Leptothoe kymatousa]MBT9313703.1 DUF3747 domain-containing protein [Leptothoe kymatousa TAU-MAC 1615]
MQPLRLAITAAAALTFFGVMPRANAQDFGNVEVDQENFVLVAAPGGGLLGRPQFMIIEQKTNAQQCWGESESIDQVPFIDGSEAADESINELAASTVQIEPLLLNFNFSGICGRSTDSNGYSIRTGDGDAGSSFNLEIKEQDGEYMLIGRPSSFPANPYRGSSPIYLGRTFGQANNGFTKIFLNSGWRLTRRSLDGRTLGHVYLTHDAPLGNLIAPNGGPTVKNPQVLANPPLD